LFAVSKADPIGSALVFLEAERLLKNLESFPFLFLLELRPDLTTGPVMLRFIFQLHPLVAPQKESGVGIFIRQ
jgi:hypothetical protein